jgi:magnesium-transporting ATPase (P-type)
MFEEANRPQMQPNQMKTNSHDLLYRQNFAEGLCKNLASNYESGIIGDVKDLRRRVKRFGHNQDAVQQQAKFLESLKETLDDKIFLYCAIAALLTILVGFFQDGNTSWIEGISILVTLVIIVMVQTKVDHYKDQRLVKLQKKLKSNICNVYRGKKGVTVQLPYEALVVGDIVELEAGMRVPADCVITEGRDVVTDETFFAQEGHDDTHF